MDTGDFAFAIDAKCENSTAISSRIEPFCLCREEIGELYEAAKADWKEVEPAIFGALLEQALDAAERRRLGAHYTPRAYVERLVVATDHRAAQGGLGNVQAAAETKRAAGDKGAATPSKAFHDQLCETRFSTRPAAPATSSMCRWN